MPSSVPHLRPVRDAERPSRILRAVPPYTGNAGRIAIDTSAEGDIPPPRAEVVQRLALFAFEALEGTRSVAQLAQWVTPEVVEELTLRRAARTEQRSLHGDLRRVVPTPGPVHLHRPAPGVVEAAVVLHAGQRTGTSAMRFEHRRDRWRATVLTVF
ncbi:Rv3235 family protein [Leucobacter allii]|uniref:Rv3235 family protein n=1 Tax=Leucobacter allii TaxID=2932247 RepID=A0ABY4FIV0_9MICO|nr:Rv3235 family protein [Leucobacter allii]UOQ56490.1 Rv3235 family protein [Leucobacter allii]UOR00923.1 Rv3235 family protein [Leucobacter allii]